MLARPEEAGEVVRMIWVSQPPSIVIETQTDHQNHFQSQNNLTKLEEGLNQLGERKPNQVTLEIVISPTASSRRSRRVVKVEEL